MAAPAMPSAASASDPSRAVETPRQASAESVLRLADALSSLDKNTYVLLNGPNLNMLGTRKPETYGSTTLADVEAQVTALASELGVRVVCGQTNYEGQMVEWVHASKAAAGIIINPGAWAHYSYALRDAVESILPTPTVEVHISNVHAREEFRHKSVTSPVVMGYLCGLGIQTYTLGLRACIVRAAEAKAKADAA